MIITVLTIVALWKMFTKAGEAGWKCLIPIYNVYIMYQIARNDGFVKMIIFAVAEGLCFALGAGLVVAGAMGSPVVMVFGVLAYIAGIVACVLLLIVQFRMYADLAQAFGHEKGFAWGLLLLTPIFIWIIGLGSDTYGGQVTYGNAGGMQNMGMPQGNMPQNGMAPNGMAQNGMPQNGMQQSNMPQQNLQQNTGAYMPPQYQNNDQK